MTKRNMLLTFSVAAVVALGLSSCSGAASGGTADSGKHIAVFLPTFASAFTQQEIDGMKSVAKKEGATVTFFDSKFSGSAELSQIEDAVTTGRYDGFVVESTDSAAIVPGVSQAHSAGIPVVAAFNPIGRDLTSGKTQVPGVVSTVWQPTTQDGDAMGQMTVDACKADHPDANPCKVGYVSGGNTVTSEQIRLKNFRKVIGSAPQKIDIVASGEGNFDLGTARTATEDMLQAHSDIDVLVTGADQMTLGAQQAAKAAGLTGISYIGVGASSEAVAAVKNGSWFGTVVTLPRTGGELYMKTLLASLDGKKVAETINVRSASSVGVSFTSKSEQGFKAEWSAIGATK